MIKRSSGILMPISSLPGSYGIGSLGLPAYRFVDFLADAGQKWWQVLPAGPTSMGDSPYQSFSSNAGNSYFIDLDALCAEGLLEKSEIEGIDWESDPQYVDYGKIYENRFDVLKKAMHRGWTRDEEKITAFCMENSDWLEDYALFMACKRHFGMAAWTQWPDEDIRLHRGEALEHYRRMLDEDVRLFKYIQFLFFRQWDSLHGYMRERGIGFIGDMPIYVAMDSSDVWASPQSFLLDENNIPREVAGVPPDYFSADGQLWGNPLYDWHRMAGDDYGWWMRRVSGAARLYDVIRIDHFRGFESFWAVPYGESTARNGRWVKGPGMDFIGRLRSRFPQVEFIAEDLGFLTDDVRRLLHDSGFPGMKVLEFAFNPDELSDYMPHTYHENCVCYAGTHDNATLAGWLETMDERGRSFVREYLGIERDAAIPEAVLRAGMASTATLFVAQLQDWLGLGDEARMNTPGLPAGNWRWRALEGQINKALADKIARSTWLYGRK